MGTRLDLRTRLGHRFLAASTSAEKDGTGESFSASTKRPVKKDSSNKERSHHRPGERIFFIAGHEAREAMV